MRRQILAVAILTTLSAFSAQAENLAQILDLSRDSDPNLKVAQATLNAGQEERALARANLLPQISAQYTINQGTNKQNYAGINQESDTDTENWSINLSQSIYNHDNYLNLSQARKKVEQSKVKYAQDYQDFLLRVAQRYFAALTASDNLRFARAEEKAIGRQMEQAQQRFEVGLAAITDVHEARASFDQARAATILADNNEDDAFEALAELTGQAINDINPLKKNAPLLRPDPASVSDWENLAIAHSPDLGYFQLQSEISEFSLDRAKASRYPTVSLSASLSEFTNNNAYLQDAQEGLVGPFSSVSESTGISATVSVPLFTGGQISASVRQAAAGYQSAEDNLDAVRRKVIRDTRNAYRGTLASVEEVKARTQAVVSAQSALEATQAGFEVGTRTIVDVLLSQRNLYQAQSNASRARHNLITNHVTLKRAAGVLSDNDLVKLSGLLGEIPKPD